MELVCACGSSFTVPPTMNNLLCPVCGCEWQRVGAGREWRMVGGSACPLPLHEASARKMRECGDALSYKSGLDQAEAKRLLLWGARKIDALTADVARLEQPPKPAHDEE